MKLKSNPATPEYVDVTLYEALDEPAEVSILVDGKPPTNKGQLTCIKNEEEGDGWVTTWRVQLHNPSG